jgi:hypothetical protein
MATSAAAILLLFTIIIVITTTSTLLSSKQAFGLVAGAPRLLIGVSPPLQLVPPGGSVTFDLNIAGEEGFQGPVNLTVVDPPKYITTVRFRNNPLGLEAYKKNSTELTIQVAPDAPAGFVNLTVRGVGIGVTPGGLSETYAALNIAELRTTTVTVTQPRTVVTTTVQGTATTTVQVTTTMEKMLTTTVTTSIVGEVGSYEPEVGSSRGIINLLQSSAIGIGITVAGIAIALALASRR